MPIIYYDTKESVPSDFSDVAQEVTDDGDNKGKYAVNVVSRKKLDEFRTNNTNLATTLEELKGSHAAILAVIGGKSGEEFDLEGFKEKYKGLVDTAQKVADGKVKGSDDIEKLVSERMEIARNKLDGQLRDAAKHTADMKAERDEAVANYKRTFIDRAVAEAFTDPELGVQPSALGDVMQKAYHVFVVEEDGALIPKGKGGATLYGENGSEPRSVREWITIDLRKEAPHYFKASTGGGAGGGGDSKQFGGMSEADFNALPAAKRLEIANQMKFRASSKR
jgi:hypothetical protein